jgi:hypothetical protein
MLKVPRLIWCASLLLATLPASGADVSNYTLAKGKVYNQANAAGPVPRNNVARFFASVDLTQTDSVTSATVQYLPSGTVNQLTAGGGGGPGGQDSLSYQAKFSSQSALDATLPDGSYKLIIQTVHDGTKNATLALTGDSYPNAPTITNPFDTNYNVQGFNVVVVSNPAAPFTLTWAPFSGGTANDYIQVQLSDLVTGNLFFESPTPGATGALNGTARSLVIPSNALPLSTTVVGTLFFAKLVQSNMTAYAGVPGYAGYLTATTFGMVTLPEDVSAYNLTKQRFFQQTSAGAPTLGTNNPFHFLAQVFATASNAVTYADVQPPGFGADLLSPDPTGTVLFLLQKFPSQTALDTAFPAGTYLWATSGVHDGLRPFAINLAADAFPIAPQVTDWAAAQHVNPAAGFTLTWNPFTGASGFDDIMVQAADSLGNTVSDVFLPYTATNSVFSAGTFQSGQNYQVQVQFRHFTLVDNMTYLGATGSARFASKTFINLSTTGGTVPLSLAIVNTNTAGGPQLVLTGQIGLLYAIDASTNLQSGSWVPLVTNTAAGGQFLFLDNRSSTFPVRFYRARAAN